MEKEYNISTGMRLFYGLLAIATFGFSIFIFTIKKAPNVSGAVYLIPLVIMSFGILIIVNIVRRKIAVTGDRLLCVNLFTRKELAIAAIKGYRIGQKNIIIEPLSSNDSKIIINNYSDFGDSDELAKWVKDTFKDLDAIDLENEHNKLLQDTSLGITERDREENLKKAKQVAPAYNLIGMVLGFGLIFFESKLGTVLLIFYPLAGIVVMIFSKGLVKFLSNKKRSVYGFVIPGFVMPAFVMFFKSLSNYSVYQYDHIWLPFMLIAFAVFGLLYATGINRSVESVTGQAAVMLVVALIYSFGSILQVNFVFDQSQLKIYHATVLDHHVTHGKHNSYYLKLSKWGPMEVEKNEDVGQHTYYNTQIGDTVEIDFKDGLLNIPWYIVTKK